MEPAPEATVAATAAGTTAADEACAEPADDETGLANALFIAVAASQITQAEFVTLFTAAAGECAQVAAWCRGSPLVPPAVVAQLGLVDTVTGFCATTCRC